MEWSSVFFPCMFCKVVKENLYAFKGKPFDPLHFPFELTNHHDYERAVQACEIHVQLTEDPHAQLKRALRFDKAKPEDMGGELLLQHRIFSTKVFKSSALSQTSAVR